MGQAARNWLIYSREHNAWWRPKKLGYTVNVNEAGRYTWHEIVGILGAANLEPGPGGGVNEFAIPAPRFAPPVVT